MAPPLLRAARLRTVLVAATFAGLSAAALAHGGTDADAHHGFAAGWRHPFTGLDHLAAMLTVGFWSAGRGWRTWAGPLAFATLLLAGAVLGLAGTSLPAVEPMIAVSLLVLGLLAASRAALPAAAAAGVAGLFALFHGAAHGAELAGPSAGGALAGLLLATVLLHLAGIAAGRAVASRSRWWPRLAGGLVAAFGVALLLPALA
ncbi:HupE/UreJ family protein [Aquabacterium sp. A7-Y]|uniref:HupE/UreJ family protein n=1 Tax=Aquabacterium sp. A7-Y TaxID=1349605 RepID=UPI00223DD387|nr:HupE/UreJ family protein [Aquabacterium sp. A7-Y]MCW7541694.1 HupE/UreJ family protein [Aquabacterium sp. A7-Y]